MLVDSSVCVHFCLDFLQEFCYLVLLQFEYNLGVTVSLTQSQKCLDSIVTGDANSQTTIILFHTISKEQTTGTFCLTFEERSVTQLNITNCGMIVCLVDIQITVHSIIQCEHHLTIRINHLCLNKRNQLFGSERVKNSAANVIKILANLLYKRNSRSLGLWEFTILFNLVKKGGKGITNNVRNLASVNPIKRTILNTFLVFDGPLDVTIGIKCICFVLCSAEQNNRERCEIKVHQKLRSIAFVLDAFVVDFSSDVESHFFSVEFHE